MNIIKIFLFNCLIRLVISNLLAKTNDFSLLKLQKCENVLMIAFFALHSRTERLPAYSNMWLDSCNKLYKSKITCNLNIVLLSEDDDRPIEKISDCISNYSTTILIRVWKRTEFFKMMTGFGLDPSRIIAVPAKLSDYKPAFGSFVESLLSNRSIGASCYSHWGWVDLDGILGKELGYVLDPVRCHGNTTAVYTFRAKGMWGSPAFSGQISVFCNSRKTRHLWKRLEGWKKYLNGNGVTYYEEIHFPTRVRAAATGFNIAIWDSERESAADHDAFMAKRTVAFYISRSQNITDTNGIPYPYLHFGFSKKVPMFQQALISLACSAPPEYSVHFDGSLKKSLIRNYSDVHV